MGIRWGRPASPDARLLRAAGISRRSIGYPPDTELAGEVAFRTMRPGSGAVVPTLAVVEELLSEEPSHDLAMSLLEQVQNLVSHRLPAFVSAAEVEQALGPKSAACWTTLTDFWAAVERWCVDNQVSLESSAEILTVENERLQAMLWTGNRTQPSGVKLGLAHAVRYEKAGGAGLPGLRHFGA